VPETTAEAAPPAVSQSHTPLEAGQESPPNATAGPSQGAASPPTEAPQAAAEGGPGDVAAPSLQPPDGSPGPQPADVNGPLLLPGSIAVFQWSLAVPSPVAK
jgi:hypothetical protein